MRSGQTTVQWYFDAILELDNQVDSSDKALSLDVFLDELAKRRDAALRHRRHEVAGFYQRFHDRYRVAFANLEFVILAHESTGILFKHNHDLLYPHDEQKTAEYSALIILHARSCQIAREVLSLIQAGFADGALARWRPLYEMATVAKFIREHGEDTAERFLKFQIVETYWEALKYEEYHGELGFEPLKEETVDSLENQVECLTDEYGTAYKSGYGWAELDVDENASRRILAEEVGTVMYSPFYKMASNAVHGGSKGSQYRLGLTDEAQGNVLQIGPSDWGFTDPAQLTALMLHHVTAALLDLGEEPHWGVMVEGLDQIAREVPFDFMYPDFDEQVREFAEGNTAMIMEALEDNILDCADVDRVEDADPEIVMNVISSFVNSDTK